MLDTTCPRCGHVVPARDVELATKLARCTRCDRVFEIGRAAEEHRRALVPPRGFTMVRGEEAVATGPGSYRDAAARAPDASLELTRRWFRLQHVVMALFCIVWDGFLVLWYGLLIVQITEDARADLLLPLCFPVLHVAAGIGLTYWALAGLFNRTRLVLRGTEVELTHSPFPWRGARTVDLAGVRGFFVRGYKARFGGRGSAAWRWEVLADLPANAATPVWRDLEDEADAHFVAAALADRFDLVPGRHSKRA